MWWRSVFWTLHSFYTLWNTTEKNLLDGFVADLIEKQFW